MNHNIKLLNSAVMPNDGFYVKQTVTAEKFAWKFKRLVNAVKAVYSEKICYESYIGYPETAKILENLLGVSVPVSRVETTLQDGDVLFIARLTYRVNPIEKAQQRATKIEDYEYSWVFYASTCVKLCDFVAQYHD